MTAGADGKTIDGMGMDRIQTLIESLKITAISQTGAVTPPCNKSKVLLQG